MRGISLFSPMGNSHCLVNRYQCDFHTHYHSRQAQRAKRALAGAGKHLAAAWRVGRCHWDADYHEENPSQNQTHEVYGRASPNSFGAGSAAALFHVEMGILKGGGCDGKSSLPGGAAGCRRHSV